MLLLIEQETTEHVHFESVTSCWLNAAGRLLLYLPGLRSDCEGRPGRKGSCCYQIESIISSSHEAVKTDLSDVLGRIPVS